MLFECFLKLNYVMYTGKQFAKFILHVNQLYFDSLIDLNK